MTTEGDDFRCKHCEAAGLDHDALQEAIEAMPDMVSEREQAALVDHLAAFGFTDTDETKVLVSHLAKNELAFGIMAMISGRRLSETLS